MAFLEIRDLTFSYGRVSIPALRNVSLDIGKGRIAGLLGASGSGKSTLLRLIAGLEKPLAGSIFIDGTPVAAQDIFVPPEYRGVGMVFQDYGLFPHMNVRRNVEFGLRKLPRRARDERVREMLALARMEDLASRYPCELSGGQQQRVALIRALAPQPRVLLLDEPFSSLDADLREHVREEVRDILTTAGITALFVSHDRRDVDVVCSEVITQLELKQKA